VIPYVLKRILFSFIVFCCIAFVSFGIICMLPGDFYTPLDWAVRLFGLDPEIPAMLRAEKALDKSFIVQFWIWFEGVILHADFGLSFRTDGPVGPFLFRRGGPAEISLIISVTSMAVAWLLGIPVGVLSARFRGRAANLLFGLLTYPILSIPTYVIGILIHWFIYKFIDPLMVGAGLWGMCGWRFVHKPMSFVKFGSCILHLLPIWFIVGAPIFVTVVRLMRMSMQDVMSSPYITVARGKGGTELRVIFKHALRNALNPLISSFGVMLPLVLMNSIIVAKLFNIPSFAQFLLDIVMYQDQHVVTAALLYYGTFLIVGNLIADSLLAATDPRIRMH
jgi:peptide/nickel transport system permease protein